MYSSRNGDAINQGCLYKANGEVATNLVPTATIADYSLVDEQYKTYVIQAYSLGLIVGVDDIGSFSPYGELGRARKQLL